MAGNGVKTRQARMIAALLDPQNRNQAAACAAADIPERTLQRWLSDPEFLSSLRAAEGAAISEAARRLVGVAAAAVGVIASIMSDEDMAPTLRLRAAAQVLDTLLRLREMQDFEQRLATLEAAQNEQ
ncbi:MAG TPA: hypothetical protein VL334_19725 [Anaerolineae bacterium]|nr:hypothetical protein [Anaerolineae bacterium]